MWIVLYLSLPVCIQLSLWRQNNDEQSINMQVNRTEVSKITPLQRAWSTEIQQNMDSTFAVAIIDKLPGEMGGLVLL